MHRLTYEGVRNLKTGCGLYLMAFYHCQATKARFGTEHDDELLSVVTELLAPLGLEIADSDELAELRSVAGARS